jgi:hypothetical protein
LDNEVNSGIIRVSVEGMFGPNLGVFCFTASNNLSPTGVGLSRSILPRLSQDLNSSFEGELTGTATNIFTVVQIETGGDVAGFLNLGNPELKFGLCVSNGHFCTLRCSVC